MVFYQKIEKSWFRVGSSEPRSALQPNVAAAATLG